MKQTLKNIAYTTEYEEYLKSYDFIFNKDPESSCIQKIEDKYLLESRYYCEKVRIEEKKYDRRYSASKNILKDINNNGIIEFICIDGPLFFNLISHNNKRSYLIYKKDLYGYSIMDMTNYENVDFIPENSIQEREPFVETFIWTEEFYCAKNNLLVVSGCFWASLSGLEFYDFTDPMTVPLPLYTTSDDLAPYLPEWSGCDDVDFVEFTENGECKLRYLTEDEEYKEVTLDILEIAGNK